MTGQPPTPTSENRSSTAVGSALAILRCFTSDRPLLGVTEVATMVGLHKSSVSRMLGTLEAEELVEQDPQTKRYRLGLGMLSIAAPLLADFDVRRVSLPILQELVDSTSESAALVIWNGREAVVVEQVATPHAIKHTVQLGTTYATADSASVRVFLAALPRARASALLRSGDVTVGDAARGWDDVLARLDAETSAGVSVNDGESFPDEVGIASPVRDHRGEVVAAVLISAPRYRIDAAALARLTTACRAAAARVTVRLGGPAATPVDPEADAHG